MHGHCPSLGRMQGVRPRRCCGSQNGAQKSASASGLPRSLTALVPRPAPSAAATSTKSLSLSTMSLALSSSAPCSSRICVWSQRCGESKNRLARAGPGRLPGGHQPPDQTTKLGAGRWVAAGGRTVLGTSSSHPCHRASRKSKLFLRQRQHVRPGEAGIDDHPLAVPSIRSKCDGTADPGRRHVSPWPPRPTEWTRREFDPRRSRRESVLKAIASHPHSRNASQQLERYPSSSTTLHR